MNYWLFKTEPGTWSWEDQVAEGDKGAEWDGVRNYQANNFMKQMKVGELGFFYHSVNEKRIVGIVRIVKEWYLDPGDEKQNFGMVDVAAMMSMPTPVTLAEIKARPELADMVLVKNSRLSVQPVRPEEWALICQMGGLDPDQVPQIQRTHK